MFNYIVRKLLGMIPMLLVITFLIFVGIEMMPGDVIDFLIPMDELARMTPAEVNQVREALGLNQPMLFRYFSWLWGIVRGDLGYSMQNSVAVSKLLLDRLPATLELSIAALLISTFLGSFLGVISAIRKGKLADNVLSMAGMIGVAIPQFLFGLVCILVFGIYLKWLPVGGRFLPGKEALFERLEYLIMPAMVLGRIPISAVMGIR